jgi:hypothetical protein
MTITLIHFINTLLLSVYSSDLASNMDVNGEFMRPRLTPNTLHGSSNRWIWLLRHGKEYVFPFVLLKV